MTIRRILLPASERGNDPADHAGDDDYAQNLRDRIRIVSDADNGDDAPPEPGEALTEDACALAFKSRHPNYAYTPAFGAWHCYDPERAAWVQDTRLQHMTLMRALVRELAPDKLHKASAIAGAISLARSNPGVAMSADQWDADVLLLGTPGEVIDLRTGKAVDRPRECHITRQTAVRAAPAGTPIPVWEAFLERVTRHAPLLKIYLQRIFGYALTGSTREQSLFFANGPGANGKSVFLGVLTGILGDYAHVASGDLLLASNGDRHPTDMASLRGKRLVTASELRPGGRWDEQRLKSLTGGEAITARFMRQDEFTYMPQLTLIIAGNHRPSFAGVDEAIRRRMRLIPFTQVIPAEERDLELPEKLRAEWPGILRWAIDGCLAWQQEGLALPDSVKLASEAYMESEDSLGQWVADRIDLCGNLCGTDCKASELRKDLYEDWLEWVQKNGGPKWSAKAFYRALEERGFEAHKNGAGDRGFRHVMRRPRSSA
jgi:putative DNA primase/helicase